jgi:transposase
VSLIAALTLSPVRRKVGLYFRSAPDRYFNQHSVADFVRHLLRHLRGKVFLVWDRWSGHRGAAIRELLARNPRLELVNLPAYAPELNPVEHLWTDLKWHRLANFAPDDVADLDRAVRPILRRTAKDPPRLMSYWRGAKLHVPWALAS